MLSIGKVGGGQADPSYYVESVAQGADDYYAHAGEAPGRWAGKGAQARGLSGVVEEADFIATLRADGGPGKTVLGYDLTFSAPKSVSVLFGVGDDELSAQVRAAHDEAVEQALGYLESSACWTRRGAGGRQHLHGEGLTVATFRHRTSRAGDPQLHTHSVVVNATAAAGKTTALDGQALYAHGRTAGFLYQAALRGELTRRVGVEWKEVENGVAEIRGVPEEVIRTFSRRSEEIRERMATHGGRSAKSAQAAALETRRKKDYDVPIGYLRDEWRARASEHGLGRDELADVLDRRQAGRPVEPDIEQAVKRMGAPGGITQQASTFDRRDVLRDWASAHREGAEVSRLEELADAWLRSDDAVQLEASNRRRPYGGARHSTPDVLEVEAALSETSGARKHQGVAIGSAEAVTTTPGLSEEQAAVVREVVLSGDGVQVIRAAAGTGKTTTLAAARRAWGEADVHVYGCALAARAAVELESLGGIDSTTVARLERDLDHGYGLPRGSVLVVDEAGMVGTRSIARLAAHCAETESKLLLVGDDHQLPEIDAGGAFRRLADELGASELRQVWRQREDWDKDALGELRQGRVGEWAERYRDHGRLVAEPTAAKTRDRLVDDWWLAARQEDDAVMIAHRRVDVAELNSRARDLMRAEGRLGEEELLAGGRSFAVGDRVLAKRNDRRLDLVNGTRGEVTEVDLEHRSLQLRLADGTTRRADTSFLDREGLMHGYAFTAHAAQGATVDRAFVLGSDDLYREWGYTAMTRHREEARYYVVSPGSVERALPGLEPDPDPLPEDVVASMSRSGRKSTAHDVLDQGLRQLPARREAEPAPAPQQPSRAAKAAGRALERAAGIEAQLADVKPWQRKLAKELRQALEVQQKDAAQWASRAIDEGPLVSTEPPVRTAAQQMSTDQLRSMLHDPGAAVLDRIGPRPDGLAGRDRWMRAATQLVSDPTATVDTPAPERMMADTGLDL